MEGIEPCGKPGKGCVVGLYICRLELATESSSCSALSMRGYDAYAVLQVSPIKGTVGFASAQSGWSFTLQSFSKLYCEVYGIQLDHPEFARRLWGDIYFHPGDLPIMCHECQWDHVLSAAAQRLGLCYLSLALTACASLLLTLNPDS